MVTIGCVLISLAVVGMLSYRLWRCLAARVSEALAQLVGEDEPPFTPRELQAMEPYEIKAVARYLQWRAKP